MVNKTETAFRWIEGRVDRTDEHFQLLYGEIGKSVPVTLVSKGNGRKFIVEFVYKGAKNNKTGRKILEEAKREISFYLVEKQEQDPWIYAKYHCRTASNLYSSIHWVFYTGKKIMPSKSTQKK